MEAGRIPEARPAPPPSEEPAQSSIPGPHLVDPGTLGLAGFALTTFVLSMVNANFVGAGATPAVFGLAFAYGGLAQLLAGMWEFRNGNTFGGLVFSSYGAFWISFWWLAKYDAALIKPATEINAGLGLYLWAWTIFTVMMTIVALRTTGAVVVVLVLLDITFALLAAGNSGGTASVIHWGGYLGIATAIAAWYTCMAGVLNSTWGRDVLPVFPLNG